jgi:hypothetical protein
MHAPCGRVRWLTKARFARILHLAFATQLARMLLSQLEFYHGPL